MTGASKAAALGMKALTIASNMAIMWAISKAIGLVANAISESVNALENAKEESDNFVSSMKSMQSEFSSNKDKIRELKDEYTKLSRGVNSLGENVSLTNEEYDNYKGIITQISDIMPELNVRYNKQGEKIGFVTGKLIDLNNEYDKIQRKKALDLIENGDENGNTIDTAIENFNLQSSPTVGGILKGMFVDKTSEMTNLQITQELKDLSKKNQKDFKRVESTIWDSLFMSSEQMSENGILLGLQEILGVEFSEVSDMTDKEFADFKDNILTNIDTYQGYLDNAASKIGSSMVTIAQSNNDFYRLTEQQQSQVSNMFNNMSYDMLSSLDIFDEEGNIVKTKLSSFVKAIITSLKNNKDGVANAYKDLFAIELDSKEFSPIEIQEKVNEAIKKIAKALGLPSNQLKIVLGFDIADDNANNFKNTLNKFNPQNDKIRASQLTDWANDKNVTQTELERLIPYANGKIGINNLNTLLTNIRNVKKGNLTLNQVFEDEDLKETTDKLLELAKAGELTPETLESVEDYNKILEKTGLSAKKTTKEINKMVSSADQLASMKTGISSISDILGQKKENLKSKKTRNVGIGADVLAGMPEDVKENTKEYERFVEVLGNGNSTMQDCQRAADNLATAYVNSKNFLANLTEENKNYYISVLKEMNVANAEEVVINALTKAKWAKIDFAKASADEVNSLIDETIQLGIARDELANYIIQSQLANQNSLDTSSSVRSLRILAEQCGATAKQISLLQSLEENLNQLEKLDPNDINSARIEDMIKSDNKQIRLELEKGAKIATKSKVKTNPKIDKNKNSSDKDKKTKSLFDWIEVKLDRINSKAEKFRKTMDLALSYNTKRKQGLNALTQMEKEYETNEKGAKRYQKQADKYTTKNGRYIKGTSGIKVSDVENGKIDITSLTDKQQKAVENYKTWYDKSQNMKQANLELIETMRDMAESIYNLPIDKAEEKIEDYTDTAELASKRIENAKNATEKRSLRNAILQSSKDTLNIRNNAKSETESNYKKLIDKNGNIKGTKIKATGEEIDVIDKKTGKVKYSGKQLEAVQKYNAALKAQKNALKAAELAQEDYVTAIRENVINTMQDIIDDFDNKIQVNDAMIGVHSSYKDMKETQGFMAKADDWNGVIAGSLNDVNLKYQEWQRIKSEWDAKDKTALTDSEIAEWNAKILDFESQYYEAEKTKADYIKQRNEQEIQNLNDQLELLDSISSEYEALLSLRDAQGAEFRTSDEIMTQLNNKDNELGNLEQQKTSAQNLYNDAISRGADADIVKYGKELNDINAQIFQKKAEQEELVNSLYDEQKNRINKMKEALQKANEEQDKRLQLEKAQYNLLKAQNQRTQKIFNGKEFVYQADEDAIKSAQEELDKLEFDSLIDALDYLADTIIEQAKKENNLYDENGNRIKTNWDAMSEAGRFSEVSNNLTDPVLTEKGYDVDKLISAETLESMWKNAESNFNNLIYKMPDYSKLSELVSKPTEQKLTISIGDINLSNVNNAEDLARDIVNRLPNTVSQYIRK